MQKKASYPNLISRMLLGVGAVFTSGQVCNVGLPVDISPVGPALEEIAEQIDPERLGNQTEPPQIQTDIIKANQSGYISLDNPWRISAFEDSRVLKTGVGSSAPEDDHDLTESYIKFDRLHHKINLNEMEIISAELKLRLSDNSAMQDPRPFHSRLLSPRIPWQESNLTWNDIDERTDPYGPPVNNEKSYIHSENSPGQILVYDIKGENYQGRSLIRILITETNNGLTLSPEFALEDGVQRANFREFDRTNPPEIELKYKQKTTNIKAK